MLTIPKDVDALDAYAQFDNGNYSIVKHSQFVADDDGSHIYLELQLFRFDNPTEIELEFKE